MEHLVRVPVAPGASFHLPPKLEGLRRLAYNLWWSWHPRARTLFSRIDGGAWARYRNPIPVLSGPVNWSQLLENSAFMAEYESILREFDAYMSNGEGHWFQRHHADVSAVAVNGTSRQTRQRPPPMSLASVSSPPSGTSPGPG